ncbi:MAG TPA: hypothetical protein VGJ02_08145 [Pyrinomonadaceae bacterium]
MQLEFDKEIDALLRKAKRGSPAVAGAPVATPHLDADELAAFAENALPERARPAYIAHMADCDTCRTMLSGFVTTAPEKAAAAAAFAAKPAPLAIVKAPWYRSLLRGSNLAYTMGGLVIFFSGFIGLLVYQNQKATSGAEISRAVENRPAPSTVREEAPQGFSNAAASNSAATSNTASPVESVTKTGVAVGSANATTSTTANEAPQPETRTDVAGAKPADQQPLVAAAPSLQASPETPKDEPASTSDRDVKAEKERNADKLDDRTLSADTAKKKSVEDQRELRSAAKTAPSKIAGPKQQQNNAQNGVAIQNETVDGLATGGNLAMGRRADLSRSVGGKNFEMRGGVWYDSAYHGGGTKDVKRGTEKYLKLDEGLRSIANDLGGIVIIVWNGKAYKIK